MAKKGKSMVTPRLRFPEFREAGEWEEKPLGAFCDVLQGYGFPETMQGKTQGVYPFCKVSDISRAVTEQGGILCKASNYIDDNDLIQLKAKIVPVGTTVFAKIGEALRLNRRAIVTAQCLIDNNTAGIKVKKGMGDDIFAYQLFQTIDLGNHCGGTVPSVNKSTLENIHVLIPNSREQKRIADCLTSLDEVISAQGQKVETLKTYKRGLMQQLFPREGETIPRLRFSKFQEDWEKSQLGSLCESVSSGRNKADPNGIFDLYGSTGIIGKTQSDTYSGDYILVARVGANAGFLTRAVGRFGVTDNTLVLVLKDASSIDFFFFYLQNIGLNKMIFGSGQPLITGGQLKEIFVLLPHAQEREQIADCLSFLDARIIAEAGKFNIMKTHKKSLMQQLFPILLKVDK